MNFINAIPTLLVALGATLPDLIVKINIVTNTMIHMTPDTTAGWSLICIVLGLGSFVYNIMRS